MQMNLSEQIKILCVRYGITLAELARKMGTSPQNFFQKVKRGTFSVDEMKKIAEVLECSYVGSFKLPDGTQIEY